MSDNSDKAAIRQTVRQNAWLLVFGAVMLALGIAGAIWSSNKPAEVEAPVAVSPEQEALRAQLREAVAQREEPRDEETPESIIAEHRAAFEADPRGEEAPARLLAMGNIYIYNLQDYQKAAECYQQLIIDYKGSESTRGAYVELIGCYEQLKDPEGVRWVYLRMLEDFPEGTQEHGLAKEALGLATQPEDVEPPDEPAPEEPPADEPAAP